MKFLNFCNGLYRRHKFFWILNHDAYRRRFTPGRFFMKYFDVIVLLRVKESNLRSPKLKIEKLKKSEFFKETRHKYFISKVLSFLTFENSLVPFLVLKIILLNNSSNPYSLIFILKYEIFNTVIT